MDQVRRAGFQSIDGLAEQFSVTAQTIRRDVMGLCDRGLLRRRHGGVELPPEGGNLAYTDRQVLHIGAKRRIAQLVAAEIADQASLFFGIGTTPEQCALALAGHSGLKVMTNNLNVALALSRNPTCEITIAGGRLRNLDRDVVAGEAHGFFKRFAVDIGIYGVGGVSEDGTLLDFSPDEIRMRAELACFCNQRFLVLDQSKFGRKATIRGGHITEATVVFSDQLPPPAIVHQLREAGTRLVVATESQSSLSALPHYHEEVEPC